jgi:hypothetical protein
MGSSVQEVAVVKERASLLSHSQLRIPAMLALFCSAAISEARRLTSLSDYDVWWHLRTGAWILQNHAVPRHALFTQYSDRLWIAYSWGFEVIAAATCQLLGLRGVPVLTLILKAGIAIVIFRLARGWSKNWTKNTIMYGRLGERSTAGFWLAVLLAAVGQYAITDYELRPGSLSIICFAIELILLFESRRTGSTRALYWLPALFLCWANFHIQFVYGVFVLALFLAFTVVEEICRGFGASWFVDDTPRWNITTVGAVTLLSILATLITPYFFQNYKVAWDYAHSTAAYSYIAEMHAMSFRWPEHYARLFLVMAAVLAIGSRRPWNLFALTLIVCFAVLGFRQQRDSWCMVLAAVAIIADSVGGQALSEPELGMAGRSKLRWREIGLTIALVIVVLAVVVHRFIPSGREELLAKTGETFPVQAANFIRDNHLPQPIFNPLNWGGFLIWDLPEYPVSIDGRTDLYGDEIVIRQYEVWDGEVPVWKEPTFVSARTLVMERNSALAQAVSESPAYRLAYADKLAAVFVRIR